MKRRIVFMLTAVALLLALAVNASADNSMPDLTKKGSLTFIMEFGGEPLTNGKLNLYYVASIEMIEQDKYGYRLVEALNGYDLDLENINDPDLATELLSCVQNASLQQITAPIKDGVVKFDKLDTGLYLVWQNEEDASEGFSPIQPFVISVPQWQNDHYALDVVAAPKVPIETEPSPPPPPPPPPPPNLPQTGQLNWPIPVMALSGVVLIILGLILCVGRKRSGHEE